jgi:hypothetical protein
MFSFLSIMEITTEYLAELLLRADRFTLDCEEANTTKPLTGRFAEALCSCREAVDYLQSLVEKQELLPSNRLVLHFFNELARDLFLVLYSSENLRCDAQALSFGRYLTQTFAASFEQLPRDPAA